MRRPSAYSVWLAYNSVGALLGGLTFTMAAVYFVEDLGMNPLQLVLVGTVMELTVFVFEVPTGIVADMFSRRLSVIIGVALQGAGMVVVGALPSIEGVYVGWVVWGIGATFESGALEAWITDEMEGRNLERVFLRGDQFDFAGRFLGILASVGLATVALRLPFLVGGVLTIAMAVALVLTMPEHRFTRASTDERGGWRAFGGSAVAGARLIRARPVLLTIVGVAFFFGMFTESLDRLWQAHFLENFAFPDVGGSDPVVWFGAISAFGLVLSFAAAGFAARRIKPDRPVDSVRVLLMLDAVLFISVLVFALAGNFALAIAAFLVAGVARRLDRPIFSAWLNQNVESRSRATVLSMVNQSDAIGQWGGGPALGGIGTIFSLRAALTIGAFVLTPALALYAHALRRGGKEPALQDVQPEGAGS